jgi:lambda family phage portal protein
MVSNVIGPGLKHHANIDREMIDSPDDKLDMREMDIEREWELWANDSQAHVGDQYTFSELQQLIYRSMLESGDVFVLMTRKNKRRSPYQLTLQVIEADRVRNPWDQEDTPRMRGGIEYDTKGAPIAYHVANHYEGDNISNADREWTRVPKVNRQTGRVQMLHLAHKRRPGQSRAAPLLTPVLRNLKILQEYTKAELEAAITASMFVLAVTTKGNPAGSDQIFNDPTTSGNVKRNQGLDQGNFNLRSGYVFQLQEGEDISSATPGRPNNEYHNFIQALLQQIGAALQIPYELLIKQFVSSYSASRAALLEAWQMFRSEQSFIIENLLMPVYEEWMYEAVARDRVSARGYLTNPKIRNAYLGADWIGPASSHGQIDPAKEVQAAAERVNNGFSSISRETVRINGVPYRKEAQKQAQDQRLKEQLGIDTNQGDNNGDQNPNG